MRIAAYQGPIPTTPEVSIGLLEQQIAECEQQGVSILCFPEAFIGGRADDAADIPSFAIPTKSLRESELLKVASGSRVLTIVGFTELGNDGRFYNSALIAGRSMLFGVYRKLHPAMHFSAYAPGSELPIFDCEGIRFGVIICNDANFAEPAFELSAQGASVIFVPMNNALPTQVADEWRLRIASTLKMRAIESGCYIVAADVCGRTSSLLSHGATAIYSPDGTKIVAAQALSQDLVMTKITIQQR